VNILIDAGHGLPDPGACSNGMREADYVMEVARYLMHYLQSVGHRAHLTRNSEAGLAFAKGTDLAERCKVEHNWRPDLFVSLHCNAAASGAARGFEVWTSVGETKSDQAAELIINEFHKAFPDRVLRRDFSDGDQDKESDFCVLAGTLGPAVLVELGFLTNAEEARWLRENQLAIVKALAAGVEAFAAQREAA
jgi:N-acetylmuramoyl-L-alanine amidase